MAEFQTVIKQFERLCNSADRDCNRCRLNDMNCSIADIVNNSIDFEKRVMAWAAEHSVVYPTWAEWLAKNVHGVDADSIYEAWGVLCKTHVPADIAEKLGIEPKEG